MLQGRNMQKKIYVAGMFDDDTAKKVDTAVRGVSGVTNVAVNTAKAQVLVDFNDGTSESAIDSAIKSAGVDVLS
jgi:copper chaperone CopZ